MMNLQRLLMVDLMRWGACAPPRYPAVLNCWWCAGCARIFLVWINVWSGGYACFKPVCRQGISRYAPALRSPPLL